MSLGIDKDQVLKIMGNSSAQTNDGIVNNPWSVEAFADGSGQYEVLYYVTSPNLPFRPVRKNLTTPVVLKDKRVVGWGESALDRISHGKPPQ